MVTRGVQQGTAAPKTKTVSALGKQKKKGEKVARKITYKYFVDASIPVEDGIFDLDHFEDYIAKRYKVEGKAGNLGNHVSLFKRNNRLRVHTDTRISKRYLKYLTKKYLKKQELRDWLHVVSKPNARGYELRYFNITQGEEGAPAQE